MLKIQIEGDTRKVKPFLYELIHGPQYRVIDHTTAELSTDEVHITCHVDHQPVKRMNTICLHTKEGVDVYIPMLDIIQSEIEPFKHIVAGSVFDILSLEAGKKSGSSNEAE